MEGICAKDCQVISKCECGEFLCTQNFQLLYVVA